uniref:NADH-ubiquinone oxidoreductase chain 3 n=1 Tax=Planorbarius corneus TaxID=240818 RepID=A0A7L7S3F3_9GAST|nr:NADH dehydrogenase subunit 3 [Planorbarius corneus]
MLLNMFFCWVVSFLMLFLYLMIYFFDTNSLEKKSPFECGFEPLSEMRTPFSMRFFILVILFLIFDIEISLLFPIISITLIMNSMILKISFLMFLMILLLGIFHEWHEGALDWVS